MIELGPLAQQHVGSQALEENTQPRTNFYMKVSFLSFMYECVYIFRRLLSIYP